MHEKTELKNPADELFELMGKEEKTEQDKAQIAELKEKVKQLIAIGQAQQQKENKIKKIKENRAWQKAKKSVENIHFNANFTVDLMFNEGGKLETANISIRKSGKQGRHISPIALIERIIRVSLQKGASLQEITNSLLGTFEIFKKGLTEADKVYIQQIFEYFKYPELMTQSTVSLLIKVVMHFYHENLFLAMHYNNKYVDEKLFGNLHHCYIVPTLALTSTAHKQKDMKVICGSEAPFVKSMLTILDNLNIKGITNANEKFMHYAIFACFDYLPFPIGSKESKNVSAKDEITCRYTQESKQRLFKVAAQHLHFIFVAYPTFEEHRESIIDTFCLYIATGINPEILYPLFEVVEDFNALKTNYNEFKNITESEFLLNYTNGEKKWGRVCGFAHQYYEGKDYEDQWKIVNRNFYPELKKDIKEKLIKISPEYSKRFSNQTPPPETPLKVRETKELTEKFQGKMIELITCYYLYDANIQKDLTKLDANIKNYLKVDIIEFNRLLQEHIIDKFLSKEFICQFTIKTQNFLKDKTFKQFKGEYYQSIEKIENYESSNKRKDLILIIFKEGINIITNRVLKGRVITKEDIENIKLELNKAQIIRNKFLGIEEHTSDSASYEEERLRVQTFNILEKFPETPSIQSAPTAVFFMPKKTAGETKITLPSSPPSEKETNEEKIPKKRKREETKKDESNKKSKTNEQPTSGHGPSYRKK